MEVFTHRAAARTEGTKTRANLTLAAGVFERSSTSNNSVQITDMTASMSRAYRTHDQLLAT
jgi:hypothetical protein